MAHEEGWGVIESPETPGGCWAYYSDLVGGEQWPTPAPGEALLISGGFRSATVGETVDFEWEPVADQDGYKFRATNVRPRRPSPAWTVEHRLDSDSVGGIEISFRDRAD